MGGIIERFRDITGRQAPPSRAALRRLLDAALETLAGEPADVRPADRQGLPGGILVLDPALPTIIVPDIHARTDFLVQVMDQPMDGPDTTAGLLGEGKVQVLCLGDGMHAEGRAAARWRDALEEFQDGYAGHASMDLEMAESLGVMAMVMAAKCAFPGHFHFLKGNHENITNETGAGNFSFRKYAREGEMVASYMERFYGPEALAAFASFEKSLPLLAVGGTFLASHAEPARFFERGSIINYRADPDAVAGLTWTDSDDAEPTSVTSMLREYIGPGWEGSFYFTGHRVPDARIRAGGRLVQLHDPDRMVIAVIPPGGTADPRRDVRELGARRTGGRAASGW